MTHDAFAAYSILFVATIVAPMVSMILSTQHTTMSVLMSAKYPWLIVGLVGTIGGTIGNAILYFVAEKVSHSKRWTEFVLKPKIQDLMVKFDRHMFWMIVLCMSTPLPDQIITIAGLRRYNYGQYLLSSFIGRAIQNFSWALIGYLFKGNIHAAWQWFLSAWGHVWQSIQLFLQSFL